MTIVVAVIAKPKGKRKPFAVISSDTRGLNLIGDELIPNDNTRKIFPFGNMYLGMAGAVPPELFEILPTIIENSDLDFDSACEFLRLEVADFLNKFDSKVVNSLSGYIRLTMLLIAIEDNLPKLARFEYDTRDCKHIEVSKVCAEETGLSYSGFIGNLANTLNIQMDFKTELNRLGDKINLPSAKQEMNKFMLKTADVYTVKCNKKFDFFVLEGEIR